MVWGKTEGPPGTFFKKNKWGKKKSGKIKKKKKEVGGQRWCWVTSSHEIKMCYKTMATWYWHRYRYISYEKQVYSSVS